MPKFTQSKIEETQAKPKGIPNEVIEQYMEYVKALEKNNEGKLEFEEGENIAQARKALVEAGLHCKKYIKVRKPRGADNILTFVLITKKEYDESQAKAKARGEKVSKAAKARKQS
jgi:hypothetical protein